MEGEEHEKKEMLLSVSSLIRDQGISGSTSTFQGQESILQEIISLAKDLEPGVLNKGTPCVSLECIVDKFVREKMLEPLFKMLSSTRRVDEDKMKKYLWHQLHQRISARQFDPKSTHEQSHTLKANEETTKNIFQPSAEEAWVKFEDLPILTNKQEDLDEEEMQVDQALSQSILSQSMLGDQGLKITVVDFLDQCHKAKEEEFDEEFLQQLCAQSESNLHNLFASCSNSNIFIPLLMNAANRHVELVVPLCDKVLLPLSKRNVLDGPLLAKACSMLISFPQLFSKSLLVPLIKDQDSRSLVLRMIKFCGKEEVKHVVLQTLMESLEWTAKKEDLELLQCLLGTSVPKNIVAIQLVCQMFARADIELKESNDFAKLLLQTIKALKSDMNDECKALLKTAVASVKSPLKTIMEKLLA